jgi:hypothetical protein
MRPLPPHFPTLVISHAESVQVLAVTRCHARGAFAAALGLSPTAALADDGQPLPQPAASDGGGDCLWGRVVLMQLQGSVLDAVIHSQTLLLLCACDRLRRCTWSSCCTRSCRR